MTRRIAAWGLLPALVGSGCVTVERGHFAALSTTRVPVSTTVVNPDAEGRVCGAMFQAPLRRAVEEALATSSGANALVDVRYRIEDLCMVVQGTAVRTP